MRLLQYGAGVLIAVAVLTGIVTIVAQNNVIADLKAENETLNKQVTELQTNLTTVQEQKDKLATQAEEDSNLIKKLQENVNELKNKVQELENTLYNTYSLNVVATHYTAYCDTGCTGVTATGLDVRNTIYNKEGLRVIAVDPNVIPLNKVVTVITPYGTFKAVTGDTGVAIKGNRIDILVDNKTKANKLGKVGAKVLWQS